MLQKSDQLCLSNSKISCPIISNYVPGTMLRFNLITANYELCGWLKFRSKLRRSFCRNLHYLYRISTLPVYFISECFWTDVLSVKMTPLFKSLELNEEMLFFYRCNVHSDIHTVHSRTDAHLLKLWLQFTLKLDGSYTFRSTTIIRELAIEPG